MKILNAKPHGSLIIDGVMHTAGTPAEVDDKVGRDLIDRGVAVQATAANVKAAEEALAPDEEEIDEEVEDKATGAKTTRKIRRKKSGR